MSTEESVQNVEESLNELDGQTPPSVVPPLTQGQIMFASDNRYLKSQRQFVPPKATLQFEIALHLIADNKLRQAKSQLEKITHDYPSLSGAWLTLGDIARAQDNAPEAQQYYLQAIDVNTDNYFARNRLAGLYRQQGQFDAAKAQYLQAIASWPGFVSGHINLAILLDLYLGDKTGALLEYQLVRELRELQGKAPDKKLKGWIADVSRQVSQLKKRQQRVKE